LSAASGGEKGYKPGRGGSGDAVSCSWVHCERVLLYAAAAAWKLLSYGKSGSISPVRHEPSLGLLSITPALGCVRTKLPTVID
jgi:hypothetical protein